MTNTKQNDEWDEFAQERGELYRKSELARNLRIRDKLTSNDALELGIECARVLGQSYIYERRELQGDKEIFRKVYILRGEPEIRRYIDSIGRVDGDCNECRIIGRINSCEADELSQPTLESLLKNECRVEIKLIMNILDYKPKHPPAYWSTHQTYQLIPNKCKMSE